jgi:hypothetical protein
MTDNLPCDGAADDDLLSQVAAGSAEAFAALYRRHQALVYRFALHMGVPRPPRTLP